MCIILSLSGKFGGRKSSSSDATIGTLGDVAPSIISVGSGVYGVATCTSYTHYNVIYISG